MTTTAGRTRPTDEYHAYNEHTLTCGGKACKQPADCSCACHVLDLDATQPPLSLAAIRRSVVSVRMPPALRVWITEQARVEQCTVNGWIVACLNRARGEALPLDVRDWLAAQAAQCGCPGDLDQALIEVVRHLSMRWPHGGRLR